MLSVELKLDMFFVSFISAMMSVEFTLAMSSSFIKQTLILSPRCQHEFY